jgi:hypothetical protein
LKISFLLIIVILFLLLACSPVNQNPAIVVQNYLKALVKKDSAVLISMACNGSEIEAQKELDSFQNVGTTLEGLNCSMQSQSEKNASVICQGAIILTYDTEIQKIDLSKRDYQLILENNEWRVCN